MSDVIWIKKKWRNARSKSAVSIALYANKQIGITIRYGLADEITKTGYIKVGTERNNRNRMVFIEGTKEDGWKITKNTENGIAIIKSRAPEFVIVVKKFIGEFEMDLNEECQFFIERNTKNG